MNGGIRIHSIEVLEVFIEDTEPFLRGVVAVEVDPGIGGMVVFLMKRFELLKCEGWNLPGIAPRIKAVCVFGKKGLLGAFGKDIVWRRIGSFHFVVDNTLINDGLFLSLQIQVPPFLLKNVWRQTGIEDRIKVDIDEIIEILEVQAGNGVTGLVGIREGVEKGFQGALEKLYEGLFDRIFSGSAEHGMFQNMSDTGRIRGGRSERDSKNLVLILIGQRQQLSSCPGMNEESRMRSQFVDELFPDQLEAMG
jgi:hypothetical protein